MFASEFIYKTHAAIRSRLMNCNNLHIQLYLNTYNINAIFIKLSGLQFKYVKIRGEVYRLLIINIFYVTQRDRASGSYI